ncbi:MAG: DUF192 domain-containing protein [candidate division NC10 bacterium]|nr:DUF192 domain-containing protein [candidate division NC10 bacterium]
MFRFLPLVLALVWGQILPVSAVEVNPPLPRGTVRILGQTTVTVSAEVARTLQEKVRGLSGRPPLKRGQGMLFVYDRPQVIGIWMKDMRFSLDILWIHAGRIVKVEKNAPPLKPEGPERVYAAVGDMVLEVPAGFAERNKVREGDPVQVSLP